MLDKHIINHRRRQMLFKKLEVDEIISFRQWARENYSPGEEISGVWHPVVQKECVLINEEKL